MKLKTWATLLLIVVIGFAIRAYRIQSLPMYGDELTMVYDTYSIAKTGMDSTGEKLPLTFKMGAGRPGGYIYFSVPLVGIFGPTIWGERLLSVLSGLGIIVLLYFLGKKLFDEKVGIFAAVLGAISPWDIYLSRGGFEAHFALFLALLGITAFLYKRYIVWAVAWGLAIHTYPTFKLTLPMLGILLLWTIGVRKIINNRIFVIGLVILLFFAGLSIRETLMGRSEQRFLSENIFSSQDLFGSIIQRVDNERTISTLPQVLKPIFINREIEYGRVLFENYVKNISPDFLILRGDGNPRHNPGEMGMLFLVDLPLVLISLSLLWKDKRRDFWFLIIWVLVTPLATMFFPESHGLRNDLMLPVLLLLSAYALAKIPRRAFYAIGVLMIVQLIYILVRIYFIAPAKFGTFWSAEAFVVSQKAIEDGMNGKKIILSTKKIDNIEYAYPVYAKIDPKIVIAQYGKFPKVYGYITIVDN